MRRPVLIPGSDVELIEEVLIAWIERVRDNVGGGDYLKHLEEVKKRLFDDD